MEDYDSLASNVSNLDVCVSHVNVMTTTIVEGQLAYMLFHYLSNSFLISFFHELIYLIWRVCKSQDIEKVVQGRVMPRYHILLQKIKDGLFLTAIELTGVLIERIIHRKTYVKTCNQPKLSPFLKLH